MNKVLKETREMKDSGIEWIGKIPNQWHTVFINQIFAQLKNKNTEMQETNLLSLSYGKIVRKNIETKEGLLPENFTSYNIIDSGDIVLRLTDLQNDQRSLRCGIAKERGIITSAYVTLRNIKPLINNYYYYLLHSYDIIKVFYGMGNGVRQGLTFDGLKKMRLLVPPFYEQQAIANYLDEKVGKIDQLIVEQKEAIEKWKEYKQTLITETVLKGLDPDVEMKDSGVEWIGEIPSNWGIVKLKNVLDNKKSAMKVGPFGSQLKGADFKEEGIPVYNQKFVLSRSADEFDTFVNEQKFAELSSFSVEGGDILITTRGSIGKVAFVPDDFTPGIIHPCIIKFSLNKSIYLKTFLKYIFNESLIAIEQLKKNSNSTIMDVVYSTPLKNVILPSPPLHEQQAITEFLDEKCLKIDQTIEQKQALIKRLEEYKQSLIYECVTGKRCVL